ncbi:CU044_5270 family protein [Streptomyces marincola]|uniref:Uncharacterized protein n=1 Tax=Streptomyces marincola TaxID=2878388 RepID=A0A1W7CZB4_9ACTN|nr:CU044_5270 family protein [Streptomyces marincola]ARQ70057.1 hypothetical protein CAG99_15450 [Streptomyces marincola]
MIREDRQRGDDSVRADLARLLPAPDRPELSADRHLLLQEHMMREIQRSDDGRLEASPARRRFALAAVPVATAAVIVAAVTVPGEGGGNGTRPGQGTAVATLEQLAAVAAAQPETEIGDDQFLHGTGVVRSPAAEYGGSAELREFEMWVAPDASEGWYTDPALPSEGGLIWESTFLLSQDVFEADTGEISQRCLMLVAENRERWNCAQLSEMQVVQPLLGWATRAPDLPQDHSALIDQLGDELGGGSSEDAVHGYVFDRLGDLLTRPVMPPEAAETLLLALAEIPDVTVEPTTDAAGRDGVGVTKAGANQDETTYIFDEETGAYLGTRSVATSGNSELAAGTVLAEHAVSEWRVVDALPEAAAEPLTDWSQLVNG